MSRNASPAGTGAEAQGQWAPLLWVAASAFAILLSYGLARSTIDSLLLDDYGSEALKYAYGAVAVAVTIVVAIYARAAARRPIGTVMSTSALCSAAFLCVLLAARILELPGAAYGLYVWKDVYVVVLVELVWTLANSAFKQSTAAWAYGFFCVAGTLGDMSGAFLAQEFAHSVGTAELLWLAVPALVSVAVVGRIAARACGWPAPQGRTGLGGVVRVVRSSRSIQLLLALVAIIQVATTLIDYSYRATALEVYPLLDDRTEVFGQVDMMISAASMLLQFLSGAFVALLGIRMLVVVLPLVVGCAALYYAVHPTFLSVAILKVMNKSLDYSLFRTSKELLYRPLSYQEKTQGKAAVDVFGYRVAKGGTTGLLLALSGSIALVAVATAMGIALWLVLALLLVARFHRFQSEHDAAGLDTSKKT